MQPLSSTAATPPRQRRAERAARELCRRLGAAELLGGPPDFYVPAHYQGPWSDAAPEVLRLEEVLLRLGGELPGDLDPTHCTTVAWYLREVEADTRIWGFPLEANPEAATARLAGGHDFAVHAGRYILDPWAVDSVPGEDGPATKYVHDREDPRDAAEIARLYGEPSCWQSLRFPTPNLRRFGEYEEEDLLRFGREGRPGALAELERRGSVLPLDVAAALPHYRFHASLPQGGEGADPAQYRRLMGLREPVTTASLLGVCDLDSLLEREDWDGESAAHAEAEARGPLHCYRSRWGEAPCYLIMAHGRSYVFLPAAVHEPPQPAQRR
jgi:hypothetical protein